MSAGAPGGVPPGDARRPPPVVPLRPAVLTCSQKRWAEGEPQPGAGGGSRGRGGAVPGQNTLTPYALSASVTGWKKVVPPEEQLPLPPEVRPIARVPE